MSFQAILLAAVVIISILINGSRENHLSSAEEKAKSDSASKISDTYTSNDFADATKKEFAADVLNGNISATSPALVDKLLGGNPANGDNNSTDSPKQTQSTAGANLADNQAETLKTNEMCSPTDASSLTGKAVLVKYFKYSVSIFEANSEKRWPIASITKLMSAVIAMEKINPDAVVTITENAADVGDAIGDFKVGEKFRARDLVKAMLVGSSNDAAVAIAESIGKDQFVQNMQKKAVDLNMADTTYTEPTGLSFLNQSTIGDLNKLMDYIYESQPTILEITRQKEIKITELKTGKSRTISNIDAFAGDSDFLGGKTGHIDASGRNLIALFNVNNKIILTIVLGADDAVQQTKKLKEFAEYCSS